MTACNEVKEEATADREIGIIKTTGQKSDSEFVFYDEDLNELGSHKMNYATLGAIFDKPFIYDGKLFLIPQGIAKFKNEQKALEIDMTTFESIVFDIKQPAINCICANDDYLYTVNTLNTSTYISACDRKTKEVKTEILDKIYALYINCDDEKVFVFGQLFEREDGSERDSIIFVFDKELNLIKEIDDDDHCLSTHNSIITEDKIYFTSPYNKEDMPSNILNIMDKESDEVKSVELEENYPLSLIKRDNILLISHYNIVQGLGGGINFYDIDTGEQKYYKLGHEAAQMELIDDKLYILGKNQIFKYSINLKDKELSLDKQIDISNMAKGDYISGIFPLKKD